MSEGMIKALGLGVSKKKLADSTLNVLLTDHNSSPLITKAEHICDSVHMKQRSGSSLLLSKPCAVRIWEYSAIDSIVHVVCHI